MRAASSDRSAMQMGVSRQRILAPIDAARAPISKGADEGHTALWLLGALPDVEAVVRGSQFALQIGVLLRHSLVGEGKEWED